MSEEYVPPKVWTWNKGNGGRFANINRPIAGATHDKELPVGRHPLQLYSLATPERREGHHHARGAARARPRRRRVRRLADQDRRGRAVRQRLRRDQPELEDPGAGRPQRPDADPRVRVRRDPAPPRGEVRRVPADRARRARRDACRGCSGRWAARPISAAASATSMPTRRPRSNTRSTASPWRRSASSTCSTAASPRAEYLAGGDYTIADMAIWPWYGGLAKGLLYGAGEFLVGAGLQARPALGRRRSPQRPAVQRGRMVNRLTGDPAAQLHERHDASDFALRTPGTRTPRAGRSRTPSWRRPASPRTGRGSAGPRPRLPGQLASRWPERRNAPRQARNEWPRPGLREGRVLPRAVRPRP